MIARLGRMLPWLLPIALAKLAVVNLGSAANAPALVLGWAAMVAFAFHHPATSSLKLALIDGAGGWARLVLIVAAAQIVWRLYDAHFVILHVRGFLPRGAVCIAALAVEWALVWWVRRDVVRRDVVFD